MNTRNTTLALGILACASAVHAMQGRGAWTWQISTDNGATWRRGTVEVSPGQERVRCRVLFGWTPDAGYAFSGAQFDATVAGLDGAGAGDTVSGMRRPSPLDRNSNQTVVATRFGDRIKIDDSRDTVAPGTGTRGVFPGQPPQDFAEMFFTTANPVSILEFDLNLDGSLGRRTLGQYFFAPSDFPRIRLYVTSAGMQNGLRVAPGGDVDFVPAEIVVACRADFNGDTQVDFFDYLDFVAAFAGEDERGDFNGDNQIDFFDYLDFVTDYDAGCA